MIGSIVPKGHTVIGVITDFILILMVDFTTGMQQQAISVRQAGMFPPNWNGKL